MRVLHCIIVLSALAGCGRLTDGYFSGQSATSTTTGSTTSNPNPTGTPTPTPTPTPTYTTVNVTCDDSIALPDLPTEAAMYDSAIPNTVALVLQDPGDANTRLAVYQVFASPPGTAPSQVSVPLNPNIADTTLCNPCVIATYNGKLYIPEAGLLEIDLSAGSTGTMTVTFTNTKFAPADGVGGGWCIQDYQVGQSFGAYQCPLVEIANGCVTVPETSASVTCNNDIMTVVQDCTSAAKTCSNGSCQ